MRSSIYILAFFSFFQAFSQSGDLLHRQVVNDTARIEFYITTRKPKVIDRTAFYYWYGTKQVNINQGGFDNLVLNGSYSVFSPENKLLQKGTFVLGLKSGTWTTWYPNGHKYQITTYKNGLLEGIFIRYNKDGSVRESGKYKKGRKSGKWTMGDHTIMYKNGLPHGKTQIQSDSLSLITSYKNGKKHGWEIKNGDSTYYQNDTLSTAPTPLLKKIFKPKTKEEKEEKKAKKEAKKKEKAAEKERKRKEQEAKKASQASANQSEKDSSKREKTKKSKKEKTKKEEKKE